MAQIKCPKCGFELPEGSIVSMCPSCFEALPAAPAEPAPRQAEAAAAPVAFHEVARPAEPRLPPAVEPLAPPAKLVEHRERAEAAWAVTEARAPRATGCVIGAIVAVLLPLLAAGWWLARGRTLVSPTAEKGAVSVPSVRDADVAPDEVNVEAAEDQARPLLQPLPGETTLSDAAATGDVGTVRRLLSEGANPDSRSADGFTPLYLAVASGSTPVAALLLEHEADPNARSGRLKETALYAAASRGDTRMAKLLVEHGADVQERCGVSRETALHAAASRGDMEMAKWLLAKGADPKAKDAEGQTAPAVARVMGHTALADLLTRKAAGLGDAETRMPDR